MSLVDLGLCFDMRNELSELFGAADASYKAFKLSEKFFFRADSLAKGNTSVYY